MGKSSIHLLSGDCHRSLHSLALCGPGHGGRKKSELLCSMQKKRGNDQRETFFQGCVRCGRLGSDDPVFLLRRYSCSGIRMVSPVPLAAPERDRCLPAILPQSVCAGQPDLLYLLPVDRNADHRGSVPVPLLQQKRKNWERNCSPIRNSRDISKSILSGNG